MMSHGGGWRGVLRSGDEKPRITRTLLFRVLRYARPYHRQLAGMLAAILVSTGLNLLVPLVLRDLIDHTIPAGDLPRLLRLALALLAIPILSAGVNVFQRWLNAQVGEGVIYDLRATLYGHLQRMSLRFFTHTRVGELMSRLNNDVVGAQNAISNTLVSMITNTVQAIALLAVMLSLEWRLTLVSVVILPLFFIASRHMAGYLRRTAREQMQVNAQMNAMVNETLNIGGVLLVKLFGRAGLETGRFKERAARVKEMGIRRAMYGALLFAIISLVGAVGTGLVYGLGGYFAIRGAFTIGTIVAFGSYLGTLYGALQSLSNAPVEFATSMASFERVFEVIDLPVDDIPEKTLGCSGRWIKVRGEIDFRPGHLPVRSESGDAESVERRAAAYGSMDAVDGGAVGRRGRRQRRQHKRPTAARNRAPTARPASIALDEIRLSGGAGTTRGPGGAQRRRQDHPHLPDPAPLRSRRRGRIRARRPRPSRSAPGVTQRRRSAW